MNEITPLSSLQPHEIARVYEIDETCNLSTRLYDIGLIEGTVLKCVGKSPSGDPFAFLIRGSVIALRQQDIKHIKVYKISSNSISIALAGNPNVGKSTVFNALTGMKQHTGNWPGKTVAQATGFCSSAHHHFQLVDLPGTYSLNAHSPEEEIAKDYLIHTAPDITIVVCDATCLERNLILVLQIKEIIPRTIVCINLMDEAKKKGIHINLDLLAAEIGLPTVSIVARNKNTLYQLLDSIDETLLKADNTLPSNPIKEKAHKEYVVEAERICKSILTYEKEDIHKNDRKLDYLFTNKFTSFPIMFSLLLCIFWLTITGANYPSQILSSYLFKIQDYLTTLFTFFHAPDWLHGLFVLGIYRVVAWVVAVMLPPMAIFFPLFTLLEDTGYLPRVAYNLDKPFNHCHSCGKQALCMCMGLGCNAAGVASCRIIHSPRERLLAILTNSLVPCNGRFPTLIALITMFFISTSTNFLSSLQAAFLLTLLLITSVLMTFLVTKLLSLTLLKGVPSNFILELPPYRRPQVCKILVRSLLDRTLTILGRAIIVAAPAGLILWAITNIYIHNISIFHYISEFLDPLARIMGLDGIILLAFLFGLPANEIVMPIIIMGYLSENTILELNSISEMKQLFLANGWTTGTAICVLIFSLFHWPCSTTLLTIKKETNSVKWTVVAALLPTLIGVLLCILANFFISFMF